MVLHCTRMDDIPLRWLFHFCLFFTGVNQVHLVLYNQFHLDQAYQLLALVQCFTELLTLDLLPSDQGQEPAASAPDIDPIITDAIEVVPLVEGNVPSEYPEQREYSTTASLALGLNNQEEYTRLDRYLHERGSWMLFQLVWMGLACLQVSEGLLMLYWNILVPI